MKQTFVLVLLSVTFSFLLNGCSSVSQSLGTKSSRPIPLKPLKAIKKPISTIKDWEIKTGGSMGDNTIHPFLDANTIFVAGGVSVTAIQKNTGKQLWKTIIGETISAGVNGSLVSKNNTPKQVFIGTENGNAISLNASTGKILWIERLSSEIQSVSPSKDNRVAFRTVDGKLHGLSSNTGELIWLNTQVAPTLSLRGSGIPIVVGSLVIAGFDNGKVAAYNLNTGQKEWEVTLTSPRGHTELERIIDVDGQLKSLGNALFSASLNGSMTGINIDSGTSVWSNKFSSSTGVEANPQAIYSSDNKGNVYSLSPQTGKPFWVMDDLQRYEPTLPVLVGPSLITVNDKKGNIHFINTRTGLFVARLKGDPTGYSVEAKVSGNSIFTLGKSGILSKVSLK